MVCVVLDAVDCDDANPCTLDDCVPETGECEYAPATFDLDGDGHRAPRPGYKPGTLDSCGDDCDDSSAAAFPGNTEICDGVDNDCNGIVDDGASFIPLDDTPLKITSLGITPAAPGGLAYGEDSYMSIYTGTSSGFDMYQTRLLPSGEKVDPIEEKFTFQNADSSGGPIIWIGDRYGVAWDDRRDSDYEIYFAILGPGGDKAYADTRLTFAPDFSLYPSLAWNGTEFVVVWQDRRNGLFEVMGQRVDYEGQPMGGNISLSSPSGFDDESPAIASGQETLGLVYLNGTTYNRHVRFQTFDQTSLEQHSEIVTLNGDDLQPADPTIIWNEDRYIIAWFDKAAPTKAIFAAAVSEDGDILQPATAITSPGTHYSRYPSLLPLGDRALVVYADDRDNNDGYELYTRMITSDLEPFSPETRITFAPHKSRHPIAAFGPDGNVGILFLDERDDNYADHVWFTRLGCVTPSN